MQKRIFCHKKANNMNNYKKQLKPKLFLCNIEVGYWLIKTIKFKKEITCLLNFVQQR